MTRTMWIALLCLVSLGPAIAIKVVTRPASPTVEAAQDQGRTELALAPNEAAKSDRLPLPDIRAEGEAMPAAQREPSVTLPAGPETGRIPDRRWQDANAKALPGELDAGEENASNKDAELPPRLNRNRKRLQGRLVRAASSAHDARRPTESASNSPPKPKTEVWHCRPDAMGSLLRSLDLSPRCNM